jgi:hypothetical protein
MPTQTIDELAEGCSLGLEGVDRGPDPACTSAPENEPRPALPPDLAREGLNSAIQFARQTGLITP